MAKINYRALWVQALEQGEVVLRFASEAECTTRRQAFYTSIRPFRSGARKHPKLEKAAEEVQLFRTDEFTLVLQHYTRALDGHPGTPTTKPIAVGREAAAQLPVPDAPVNSEKLAEMAQEVLRKVERTTPYYKRGGEEG